MRECGHQIKERLGHHSLGLPLHDRQEASIEDCEGYTVKEIQEGKTPSMDINPFLFSQIIGSKKCFTELGE